MQDIRQETLNECTRAEPSASVVPVSYTHLDVYKRQAYVSPGVEGKVLRHRGGETRVLRPGYVKPKHEFNYRCV